MKLLSQLTLWLKQFFNIGKHEMAYRELMLVVTIFVTTAGLLGYTAISFINNSLNLAFVLLVSSLINIVLIVLIKIRSKFKLVSSIFAFSMMATMLYLVFDSGRSGFGYIWFYALPVVYSSILGVKRGSILSVLFIILLVLSFMLPDYYLDDSIYSTLKPRLIASLVALIILIVYKEYTVELFKKERNDEGQLVESSIELNKTIVNKLSNQIRYITNDMIESINHYEKKNKNIQDASLNPIKDASYNLVNIINNIGEFSSLNINDKSIFTEYNLYTAIDKTINLFSSYKNEIHFNIDKNIPAILYGNPLVLKQIVYNIIDNFIKSSKAINIEIIKGAESSNYIEIKYFISSNLDDKKEYSKILSDCRKGVLKQEELVLAPEEEKDIKTIISLVEALDGKILRTKHKQSNIICFNHKIQKDSHYKPETINELSYSNSLANSQNIEGLIKQKLNKMKVLLMEDNLITQKTILFSLEKSIKHIDIANNGKEGLDFFYKNKYDLILLDINMPVMNGYEVAGKIRSIELGSKYHVPIIAVISDYMAKDIEKIMESGVDEYISKPFKTAELVKKLNILTTKEKI